MESHVSQSSSPRSIRRTKSLLPFSLAQAFSSSTGSATKPPPSPPPVPCVPFLRPMIPAVSYTPPKPSLKIRTSESYSSSSSSQSYSGPESMDSSPLEFAPPDYRPPDYAHPGRTTIRPSSRSVRRPLSLKDIRRAINDIAPRADMVVESYDEQDSVPHSEWSDEVFEVGARLGEGIGGAVHQVKDLRTQKLMARKTIPTREASMKQLIRELSLISTVAHENIVHFYGAYMSPSSSEVKVVMELCEGKSLEAIGDRIRRGRGRVGEKVAGRLAEGILQGLAYLHSKKLIHRDIKPSNILLSRTGVVKLCDFGVSGELVESHADTFTGTRVYMAPERITGGEYSIRADVWSTGLSILELAQNRFPFPQDLSAIDLVMHISRSEPPCLEDEPQVRWSSDMKDFIRASLMVDPARRPIPREMLLHPWIAKVMRGKVDMGQWIGEVWRWNAPKPPRVNSKENLPAGGEVHEEMQY